jgi:hypothetical protein
MVLMRTKEPVRMTAGKFFVISLETFSDVRIYKLNYKWCWYSGSQLRVFFKVHTKFS